MPHYPNVIIGAGIAGSVLAHCLRRKNMAPVVFERAKRSPTRNSYGITLSKSSYRSLLGLLDISESDFKQQVAVQGPCGVGPNLLKAERLPIQDDTSLRVNRASLMNLLRRDLDIKWEHDLTGIGEIPGPGPLRPQFCSIQHKDEEQEHTFSLLFGADGVHSKTRSVLELPKSAFGYRTLPYVVFNGKRRLPVEGPLEYSAHTLIHNCFLKPDGITHTKGNTVLSVKPDFINDESEVVGISYSLSRPAGEGDRSLLERSVKDAEKLAEQFVAEVSALEKLPQPFSEVFNPDNMANDRLLHWLMRSSLTETPSKLLSPIARVILLGDAAHAQPIPGNGANAAIEDALELAKHIRDDDDSLSIDQHAIDERHKHWAEARRAREQELYDMHFGGRRIPFDHSDREVNITQLLEHFRLSHDQQH